MYGFPRRAWEPDQALPATSMEGGSANGLPGAIVAIRVGGEEGGNKGKSLLQLFCECS